MEEEEEGMGGGQAEKTLTGSDPDHLATTFVSKDTKNKQP